MRSHGLSQSYKFFKYTLIPVYWSRSFLAESLATIPPDTIQSLPASESRRRAASFVNSLRTCIACCKKTLVDNAQVRKELI